MIDESSISPEVNAERERCAAIADSLAEKWEASATRVRERYTRRFFFGLGKPYIPSFADACARDIEAAAKGLRTVAQLIRDGARPIR